MKAKKLSKKLMLRKETIAPLHITKLESPQLNNVHAGAGGGSCHPVIVCLVPGIPPGITI